MHGGYSYDFNSKNRFDMLNAYQNKIQIQNKSLLNENQIFNTKDKSANYLIEYFEGIILNYISLYERQGKRMDKLKNFILSHDKNIKFKGGDEDNKYIKEHKTYKEYKKDEDIKDENILPILKYKWKHINIEINIDYRSTYDIHIKHNNNELNNIDLIIDLQHNTIIDNIQKSYNNNLCDSTKNILYILSQITERLIESIYNNTCDDISLCICDGKKNDDGKKNVIEEYDDCDNNAIFKGIISLLIMILTLKNNVDENIYKKYNTAFLLSCIYEKFGHYTGEREFDYNKSFYRFNVNNKNLLTYNEKNHLISFDGDCALNVLMTVKNEDIRELFVDKISLSQKKSINEEKKKSEYYVNKINEVFKELQVTETFVDYVDEIKDFVEEYTDLMNFIDNDFSNFKNDLTNKKYTDLDEKYRKNFRYICGVFLEFIYIIRNNLLDYNFEEDENNKIDKMLFKLDMKTEKMAEIYMNEDDTEDYNITSRKFVKIIDIIIKYKDSFNIFYINLLISLLLIKHKINYMFDTNIMKILKHSENKMDIIKCFRHVCYNDNEYGFGLPAYQKGDGDDKYLFKFSGIRSMGHAVLFIINIDINNNKKVYLYDIDDLIMYCTKKYDRTSYGKKKFTTSEEYYIYNTLPRWFFQKYNFTLFSPGYMSLEIIISLNNIASNNDIVKSLNKINIFNEKGYIDFKKIHTLKYDECNEDAFNSVYYNYKKLIFEQLLDYCNNLKNERIQSSNNDFIYTINFIDKYINENIINHDNNTRNLLHKIIDCLVQCKYKLLLSKGNNINLNDEYKNILKYMTNTYSLATGKIGEYLDFISDNSRHDELVSLIINIIRKIRVWAKNINIVYGGNDATNSYNSIIKKVLIILLIIVIIIIVVLIVLYIINKYNNNLK